MRYMVTGGAGFIGSHLCDALLARGDEVLCVDNFNSYYDPARKQRNIVHAQTHPQFQCAMLDIRDRTALAATMASFRPERIAHLAAMAGPRPSVEQPLLYEEVNVRGTLHILDLAHRYDVGGLVLASTSSVYGIAPTPWSEESATDRPLSPYAATKKSAEILAYTMHYQHGVPTRVVRFFTVYGPRGRPDMTPSLFIEPILRGRPITLFNGGVGVYRDWTYVDDIIQGVLAALDDATPFDIFNLGNSNPVQLCDFIAVLERVIGRRAMIESRPLPPADPPATYADVRKASRLLGFQPRTSIEEGLARFWSWYRTEFASTIGEVA